MPIIQKGIYILIFTVFAEALISLLEGWKDKGEGRGWQGGAALPSANLVEASLASKKEKKILAHYYYFLEFLSGEKNK